MQNVASIGSFGNKNTQGTVDNLLGRHLMVSPSKVFFNEKPLRGQCGGDDPG